MTGSSETLRWRTEESNPEELCHLGNDTTCFLFISDRINSDWEQWENMSKMRSTDLAIQRMLAVLQYIHI